MRKCLLFFTILMIILIIIGILLTIPGIILLAMIPYSIPGVVLTAGGITLIGSSLIYLIFYCGFLITEWNLQLD